MPEYTEARRKRDLFLFILAGAFLGLYAGLYEPSFNNYLNDVFHIGEVARGGLEFPLELPGFLVVFTTGLLPFLPDVCIAVVANLVLALGLLGLGFRYLDMSYSLIFALAGLCAVAAAVCLLLMVPRPSKTKRQKLLFKRKYTLFYWLNVLFGALTVPNQSAKGYSTNVKIGSYQFLLFRQTGSPARIKMKTWVIPLTSYKCNILPLFSRQDSRVPKSNY
ncbi:hypothetical protein P378_02070 [Desulforamulus profundi]|uniref:Uncharacterized protein n=1 Tax=Desulforamulus profundi TaxID=1383067 RepID=A0A2C6MH97_9FIRM|nr:hypothetical protein [Desulforamulus profundi]PHJ39638.1 hypothetical protein P378_02070 [Desulforamulus profundi]